MYFRVCRIGVENLRAVIGLEIKLDLRWSDHGSDMVPKSTNYLGIYLLPFQLNLENVISRKP